MKKMPGPATKSDESGSFINNGKRDQEKENVKNHRPM
jgi:hypothetical protein